MQNHWSTVRLQVDHDIQSQILNWTEVCALVRPLQSIAVFKSFRCSFYVGKQICFRSSFASGIAPSLLCILLRSYHSTYTRLWVPAAMKHPQSMMLPHPCFMVGTVCLHLLIFTKHLISKRSLISNFQKVCLIVCSHLTTEASASSLQLLPHDFWYTVFFALSLPCGFDWWRTQAAVVVLSTVCTYCNIVCSISVLSSKES